MKRLSLFVLFSFAVVSGCSKDRELPPGLDRQLAFPGAEGYGRFAKGGRGGDVYIVTQLDDDGPGSLRAGIKTAKGPRTIVFAVSGTIRLKSPLRVEGLDGLTIAGQTAPGDGITLRDHTFQIKDCSNVIVRYLRVRLGDSSKTASDTINLSRVTETIFDHVTSTWGIDGNMDTEFLSNFTLQWSLFGEALHESTHHKGGHAMLMSFRKTTGPVSLHHNLFFSSRNRHPSLGGGSEDECNRDAIFDYRNNVSYNWEGALNLGIGKFNLINNYFRPGPDTRLNADHFPIRPKVEIDNATFGSMSGSVFEWNPAWSLDNHQAMQWGARDDGYPGKVPRDHFDRNGDMVEEADRPQTHSAMEAYVLVLANAGASLARDAADSRVIQGIHDRSHRRIDSQKDVGGWPELKSKTAPKDTDQDGMPDAWEEKHGLDKNHPDDRNLDQDKDGYTNLEEYLNSLVPSS